MNKRILQMQSYINGLTKIGKLM